MNQIAHVTLAVLVVASAFAGGALATSHATIAADPATPAETSTHTVTVTVPEEVEGSWNGLEVDYGDSGADVSDVDEGDVVTVGIDRGGDAEGATVDENVSDDLSNVDAINNGQTLQVGFGGSYDLAAGDEVVLVFEDAVNPATADQYEIDLEVNYQSSGGEATATLTIEENETDDATATDDGDESATDGESTNGDAADATDGTTEASDGDAQDDSAESAPGFGIVVAALALVGTGLLASRRRS